MEIVSYGWLAPRDSGARYRDQLCTSIEHVPGEIDFGSCASVAQMAEEDRPIRIELSMQQLSPKAERRTEIGGMLAPAVASVEVRFHRRGQSKRYSVSATVARPYSELQEELKQPGPFGYFVSQLKGLVGLGAIRVLAFDESGNLLGVAHGLSSQPLS
jgi:hypothetical protein